jgi:2-polyprenyl-3-methyl-5-hydroxy-6-metoxy-1,4-benzoquinol methylase
MEKMLTAKGNPENLWNKSIYSRSPIAFHGKIPVFSEGNEYIKNYEQIADDHLNAVTDICSNPWIDEISWLEIEQSTSEIVRKWSKDDDMILDVGVGLGRVLGMIPGNKKYGMDIAIQYLAESEKKGIEVCMAAIEDMPYKKNLFDLIICTDVLEHVLNFHWCMDQILSVLKPGGVLVLRVPYKEPLQFYTGEDYPYYYAHVRNFDEHSLTLQFTRIFNCEVIDSSLALYIPRNDKLKYQFPILLSSKIQLAFLKIIKKLTSKYADSILKAMIEPTVINMAFRKG